MWARGLSKHIARNRTVVSAPPTMKVCHVGDGSSPLGPDTLKS